MAYEARPAFSAQNLTNIVTLVPVVTTDVGTYLSITQDVDAFTFSTDVDGAIYSNLVANNMSTAVVNTQYGNPANALLQVSFETQRTTGVTLASSFVAIGGLGAILTSVSAVDSVIVRPPTQNYSKEASAMLWSWNVKLYNTLRA